MFLLGKGWPALFFISLFTSLVKAQASPENPFIWQILAEYDVAESNKTKMYVAETSLKIYSQDFQTVFENKDRWGYNERLVIDFGDGCPQTTMEDVERLNNNWVTSPAMMSQPSIALVQRGGRCLPWSDKISTIQNLSDKYALKITGIVVYDNNYYNDSTFIQESTEDVSYPKWTSALPDYRNIKYMTDNSIDTGSTFAAVYFVPRSYIDFINSTLIQKTLKMNGTRQMYTQLTFSLGENSFPSSSDPSASSTNSDQDDDNMWDLERDKRNYIIYSVTAAVIIILVFVITRWCRAFARSRVLQDVEAGAAQGNLLMQDKKGDVIPFDQLQHLGPIEKYSETTMLNATCAICLDDFESDYYVRVLPCHHGYCTACIDVWLTKKSSNCPICKYDCRETLQEKGLLVAEESVGTTTPSAVRDLSIPTDTATEVHIEMEPVSHSNQRDNPATANNNAH
ncbi:hypothetical protein HMPREF1544_05440 [Mucor circinelloides 1006PhL]|uniref:RING-type domain-containing protein n=1 Tax=Mucor circinelloides f. circinelloides (strain 1006PhL) TaxID=1220926 RepID=S2K6E0_MUCC1|nr:hypothetical protein HMPREF1544_05440 [Mucor circinelloides 1006PhL]KAG1119960.1 hypothetical protein G6F42_012858 [Rhizopus arrhizus]